MGHHLVEMLSISPSWPTTGSSKNHPTNGNFHREGDDEPSSWGTVKYSMFRKTPDVNHVNWWQSWWAFCRIERFNQPSIIAEKPSPVNHLVFLITSGGFHMEHNTNSHGISQMILPGTVDLGTWLRPMVPPLIKERVNSCVNWKMAWESYNIYTLVIHSIYITLYQYNYIYIYVYIHMYLYTIYVYIYISILHED